MRNVDNTKEKIIEVATRLFLTKGYEKTRISDILTELDGMTKGAIYHHFESKEDIFDTVMSKIGEQNKMALDEILSNSHLNGAEKLQSILHLGVRSSDTATMIEMSPSLLKNPKLLASFLDELQNVTIPEYIYPTIEQGIDDGSIQTDNPRELAELIGVLFNIWLNPLIFYGNQEIITSKISLISKILKEFGLILFDSKEDE